MKQKIVKWLDVAPGGWAQSVVSNIIGRLNNLEDAVCKLKKEAVLEDINCPVCKRVTLGKKLAPIYIGDSRDYYCYGCGKQFEKVTDEKLVERISIYDTLYDTIHASIICECPEGTVIKGGDKKVGKPKTKCAKEPVKSGKK
jgi:transposase-like protein